MKLTRTLSRRVVLIIGTGFALHIEAIQRGRDG